jgi:hypothetical protein
MQSVDHTAPTIAPSEKHGVIEVDTFCTGCHYNLHGQVVSIDERLGFPICRCPECGRFHPAGVGVTASGVWLRRWANGLLLTWVLMVLAGFIAAAGLMAILDGASIGIYTNNYLAAPDGRPVTWAGNGGYVIEGTTIPIKNPMAMTKLYRWDVSMDGPSPGWLPMVLLTGGSFLVGLLGAVLCVTLMWHWPPYRYFLCLLVPIGAAILVSLPFYFADQFGSIRGQCLERIAFQSSIGCIGLTLGVIVGRSISRTIIRIVVPPRPRQALAFLWQVDGKRLG